MLTTDQRGAIAESAIVHAALKLGLTVYKPVVEGGRCDLVIEHGSRLLRIQCKWARRHGDDVTVQCHSNRRSREGFVKRQYTVDDVDFIAAYCPDVDRCFLIPPRLFPDRWYVHLRLAPTRNNQKLGVNWADDFDLDATLRAAGP